MTFVQKTRKHPLLNLANVVDFCKNEESTTFNIKFECVDGLTRLYSYENKEDREMAFNNLRAIISHNENGCFDLSERFMSAETRNMIAQGFAAYSRTHDTGPR